MVSKLFFKLLLARTMNKINSPRQETSYDMEKKQIGLALNRLLFRRVKMQR